MPPLIPEEIISLLSIDPSAARLAPKATGPGGAGALLPRGPLKSTRPTAPSEPVIPQESPIAPFLQDILGMIGTVALSQKDPIAAKLFSAFETRRKEEADARRLFEGLSQVQQTAQNDPEGALQLLNQLSPSAKTDTQVRILQGVGTNLQSTIQANKEKAAFAAGGQLVGQGLSPLELLAQRPDIASQISPEDFSKLTTAAGKSQLKISEKTGVGMIFNQARGTVETIKLPDVRDPAQLRKAVGITDNLASILFAENGVDANVISFLATSNDPKAREFAREKIAQARKLSIQEQIDKSAAQGSAAAQIKVQAQLKRRIAFTLPGSIILNKKTLGEELTTQFSEADLIKRPDLVLISDDTAIDNIHQSKGALSLLAVLNPITEKTIKLQPGLATFGQALDIIAKSNTGFPVESEFAGLTGTVAQMLASDVNRGRPSDPDFDRVRDMVPKKTDSIPSARLKLDILDFMFKSRIKVEAGILDFFEMRREVKALINKNFPKVDKDLGDGFHLKSAE